MKKFENLWVSALLSAAAPLTQDCASNQSQSHGIEKSAEKNESVKLNDESVLANA